MTKSIFLTGSRGFIGSHLLPKLTGYDVHCAERNELPADKFYYDYIIHLAGVTTTSDSFIPELFESNIVYAKQIMNYHTRIIYASSTSAAELTNPYAYTKRYIEWLAYGRNATGLRFFNCYGPGNNKGIIKKALDCCRTDDEMHLYGGANYRDFIYIDDVVNAIMDNLDSEPGIVEVGTGHGTLVYEAVMKIQQITGKKFPLRVLDGVKTDMKYSIAKPGIKGCLGFEEGIRRMLNI